MELRDQIITASDLPERLDQLPGWQGDTSSIATEYPVGWDTAVVMAVRISTLAIEMAHRPDLDIRWTGLRVTMTTHTAGDVVTELDLAMAGRINAIAAATAPVE